MTAHARHAAGAFERMKQHWHDFERSRPGQRFQERTLRRRRQGHNALLKALYLGAGFVLFAAGVSLVTAPGPGVLVLLLGASLIAEESAVAAHVLDWVEVRVRRIAGRTQRYWQRASIVEKALTVVTGAFATLTVTLITFAMTLD